MARSSAGAFAEGDGQVARARTRQAGQAARIETASRAGWWNRVPAWGIAGAILIAVAWPLAWSRLRPWSEYTFFPLWLGYILVVDALTALRSGTSLLTRDPRRFLLLFAFSVPLWWLFEFANQFLENWLYVEVRDYHPVVYALLASLAFSTVMPAVFATAELLRTFGPFSPARRWFRIAPSRSGLVLIAALGLAMFVASLVFPDVAFPLVWIGVFLLLDAVNRLLGAPSIAAQVAEGRWDTVLVLFAAGLVCGFFWELWNIRSAPKWVYDVPHVTAPKLFEMPLPGYGGYLPFALEIYAFYHVLRAIPGHRPDRFLHFDRPAGGDNMTTVDTPARR